MAINTIRGVALYIGALLGPGLLVLPGLAAAQAGPASILAWAGLLVLSGLVAAVFARFGATYPSDAGAAGYARLGLGGWAGPAVGWCFLAGIVTGAPVVCYLGAGYLAELLGAGRGLTALAAAALLLTVLAVSQRGIRTSASVQLVLVGVLVLVIAVAVVGALPGAERGNWTPFAPYGWSAVGSAATVLMLSFVGWEAIAPLTDRFADPRRQLPRVIGAAFVATAVVYLALAAVTVAALGTGAGTAVPVADLLTRGIGRDGDAVAAGAAVLLTVVAANAYLAGGATLARTLTTRCGPDFPRWFLVVLLGSGLTGLGLVGTGMVSIATAVSVPSAFFFAVYLACMASAVRVLAGPVRVAAVVASGAIVVVLAYAQYAMIPVAAVVAVSVLLSRRRPAGTDRTPAASGSTRPDGSGIRPRCVSSESWS